jgi:phosphoenolpyruvate-protein kinase (PTS system EI component)
VVASMLGPTEFIRLAAQPPLGLCLAAGALLPAAAAIARQLELPTVVGLGDSFVRQVQPANTVVVDGGTGLVEVEPEAEAVAYYRDRQRLLKVAAPTFDVTEPARTADGWRVDVRADLERPEQLVLALAQGAESVGLARSDFLFVGKSALPTEDEQEAAYRDLLGQLSVERVHFCTLSVGREEMLPFPIEAAEPRNPLLGLRGTRLSLAHLSAFREQLRALLRAAAGRTLGLVFPMLETVSEVRASQEWLRRAQLDLEHAGVPYCQDVTVSLLVQIPLALLRLEPLLAEADGCYLDLDRLAEYLQACDRGNRRVVHLFRPLHPAILHLVNDAVGLVHRQGKRLDVCGEAAGSPGAAALLLGLGVDGFCLPAEKIAATKRAVRAFTIPEAQELAESALRLQSAAEVEALTQDFLEAKTALM